MKRFFSLVFAFLLVILAIKPVFAQYSLQVDSTISAGEINGSVVLDKNKKYLLNGVLKVNDGGSLTIPAGTLIYGAPNQIIGGVPVIGGTLIIRRGGKIFAEGTAQEPIIFTSSRPVGQRAPGDWGGIIILGKATNNQGTNVAIEGLTNEFHGGTDDNDNSGIMRYVRIEFAGFELSPNNEVNSLTMGSVGRGTIIENIQCSYGLDDAFEWFGGTVNGKYLIAYKCKDDDFDTDFGWRGKVQFGLSWKDSQIADQSRSEAFESDNDGSGSLASPRTAPVFSNITAIGPKRAITDVAGTNYDNNFYYGVHQRRASQQSIFNSLIMGYNQGGIYMQDSAVATDMQNGTAKFRYNFVDGTTRGTANYTTGGFVFNTYFDTYNTNYSTALNQVNLKIPFNQNAPGVNPLSGSALLSSANFTDAYLSDPFFTPVSYVGAFPLDGDDNWDRGWANYDPQNTPYGYDDPSNITDFAASIFLINTNNESRQVVIGRHPLANDGLNTNLGETNLPPVPPTSVIDIRCELPGGTLFSPLDLRATGTVTAPIVYKLNFQPGTTLGKLVWDPNLLGPGTWSMKVGTLVNINMKATNQADIATDLLNVSSVTVEVEPRFTFVTNVASNWNLISVPGLRPNMAPSAIYTTKDPLADVFKYNNGYQAVSTLVPGEGYWLKSTTNANLNLANTESVVRIPYRGNAGWNIIGSYEYIADVNFIRTAPENKITGQVFKYVPGASYQAVSILEDGFGYWINLTANANIIIPGPFFGTLSKSEENLISQDWGKIVITDAAGQNYSLYASDKSVDLDMFNLPPLPPAGMFDVRFGSQRYVENLSSSEQTINLTGVIYPVNISVDGISLKLQDLIDGSLVNTIINDGESYQLTNSNINMLKVGSENVTPNEFALEQNYPNPFNPSTTIKFAIPEASNVRLTIYNTLGQKVVDIVNSTLEAGSYSFNWDASNLASGLYFYELNTNNFSAVKKMMLLK